MTKNSTILMKYAIYYLSKYSSSKANLEIILKKKIRRIDVEKKDKFLLYNSITKIVNTLELNNLINDCNYTSSKFNFFFKQGKSKMFIKNYFQQKGIERNIIDKTFQKASEENYNWELESAKIFAKKKRLQKYINDKEKNLSKLARAGFNYEISRKTLEDL
jgi:SOS response regulatory protein OraA/RecX